MSDSIKDIIYYITLFIILFVSKHMINFIMKVLFNKSIDSISNVSLIGNGQGKGTGSRIEQLKAQIAQLRIEEDKLNTPSLYVKCFETRRERIQLEKQLAIESQSPSSLSNRSNSTNNTHSAQTSSLPFNLNIPSIAINIIYWIINLYIVISTRNVYLTLSYSDYSSNVLVNYYHSNKGEDNNIVNIPLSVILFSESLFLNQMTKVIKTISSSLM